MRIIYSMLLLVILLFSCVSEPEIHNVPDVPLMIYRDGDKYGYINSETFEIVIPAQYGRAGDFVADFAVVRSQRGKPFIINKNNKKVLSGFDYATLLETEDKKMVFALLGNDTGFFIKKWWHGYIFGGFYTYELESSSTKFKLYNLTTGKMVMRMGKDYTDDMPKIRFFGNYLTYETTEEGNVNRYIRDIYEIKNDGRIVKTTMSIQELIEKIITENNLQYNEKYFHFDNEWAFYPQTRYRETEIYDWLKYFNTLDIDKLVEQLPDNMAILRTARDSRYKGNKPTLEIDLVDNLTHPLKDKLFFQVKLRTNKDGQKFVSENVGEAYTGLYNASENLWAIPPIKSSGEFMMMKNDWVVYDPPLGANQYYNIRTRKKHTNQVEYYNRTFYYIDRGKEPIIEDF